MKQTILSLLFILVIGFPSLPQAWNLDSMGIRNIEYATMDIAGNVYISDDQGTIFKIVPAAAAMYRYSSSNRFPWSQIQTSQPDKIYAYSNYNQTSLILDRFLNPISDIGLNPVHNGSVTCISITPENLYWMFDESSMSVKKTNPSLGMVLFETPLANVSGGKASIRDIREYQNRIYLLDWHKGIIVLDLFGNLLYNLPAPGIEYFYFTRNSMVYKMESSLIVRHLYDERQNIVPGIPADARYGFPTGNSVCYITGNRLMIKPGSPGIF